MFLKSTLFIIDFWTAKILDNNHDKMIEILTSHNSIMLVREKSWKKKS